MSEKFTREMMVEEAKSAIIERLANGYEGYLCDLHNEVFNMECYEYYTDRAEAKLNAMGGYTMINDIITYQKEEFGEVTGDFDNSVWVLNMVWYMVGEEALADLMDGVDLAEDFWNEDMTEEDSMKLAKIFKAKMIEE